MSEISIEIVPRSKEHLLGYLKELKHFSQHIDVVNIPDLLRMEIRSWKGSQTAKQFFSRAIPHIRAIDFDLNKEAEIKKFITDNRIDELLIINGDPPPDNSKPTFETTPIQLCILIKKLLPETVIYGGIDQYRPWGIEREVEYTKEKVDAGFNGFFTNPFFDIELLKKCADCLKGLNVYFGISPVTSENSMKYWEKINHVHFPESFDMSLQWNIDFATEAISLCRANNFNTYIMPIKLDLHTYLSALFS